MEWIYLCLFTVLCLGIHKSSSETLRRQKRDWIIDSFKIKESYKGPFPITLGTIKLDRNFTVFQMEGQGVLEEPIGTLSINEETGEVTLHKPVDYELYPKLKLSFKAVDRKTKEIDTQLGVEIIVEDSNDNAPKFIKSVYPTTIPENTKQGEEVMILKAEDEDSGANGQFNYRLVSVEPKADKNVEFILTESTLSKTARITFNGCLEYKRANKYTIIVEAKDHGIDQQLSSTCTIIVNIKDSNNHLPEITGKTGPGKVKEGQEDVEVLRLKVKDDDAAKSPAWRAVFKIDGDPDKNFKMITDPETNEGHLIVEKRLDFESNSKRKLNITVKNEIPYHSCKVQATPASGPWEVLMDDDKTNPPYAVTVDVEDVNDAPDFKVKTIRVTLRENTPSGKELTKFTAKDPDGEGLNKVTYKKGDDPADYVAIDPETGKVTTSKPADRESSFVKNNTYEVKILASDNGKPSMTGTGTLILRIVDENDNVPTLSTNVLDICQSDKPSKAKLEASDLDEGFNSGPFTFKLLGDVAGKWRVEPAQGESVDLVKESKVHSGQYNLDVEVADMQYKSAVYNLTVSVCQCANPEKPNCRIRKSAASAAGAPFVGIVLLALLLVAGLLLLAFLVSCKKKMGMIIEDEGSGQKLMSSNIETPGTDCKVVPDPKQRAISQYEETIKRKTLVQTNAAAVTRTSSMFRTQQVGAQTDTMQQQGNYRSLNMGASSTMRMRQQNNLLMQGGSMRQRRYWEEQNITAIQNEILPNVLHQKLYTLQAPGEELFDYAPRVYAEEKNAEPNEVLDAISIPDEYFDPNMVVDSRFNHLASICMNNKNAGYTDL